MGAHCNTLPTIHVLSSPTSLFLEVGTRCELRVAHLSPPFPMNRLVKKSSSFLTGRRPKKKFTCFWLISPAFVPGEPSVLAEKPIWGSKSCLRLPITEYSSASCFHFYPLPLNTIIGHPLQGIHSRYVPQTPTPLLVHTFSRKVSRQIVETPSGILLPPASQPSSQRSQGLTASILHLILNTGRRLTGNLMWFFLKIHPGTSLRVSRKPLPSLPDNTL